MSFNKDIEKDEMLAQTLCKYCGHIYVAHTPWVPNFNTPRRDRNTFCYECNRPCRLLQREAKLLRDTESTNLLNIKPSQIRMKCHLL
jgi:hypothetical protein